LSQVAKSTGASSQVVLASTEVRSFCRASRMPRSASSVTLKGSQAPAASNASRGKWLDVPPSGTGRRKRSSAGRMASNSTEYSMVNWRVSQLR
jgi:hypothetical protein